MMKRVLILLILLPVAKLQSGAFMPEEAGASARIKKMIPTILAEHNNCRKASSNDLANLKWNKNLAAFAQAHAERLMKKKELEHSSNKARLAIPGWKEQWIGENLGYGMNSQWNLNASDADLTAAFRQTIRRWCSEKQYYNYSRNTCKPGEACGHYTQVVWEETTQVGCGVAVSKDGTEYIIVCNYGPGGNISGLKPYGGKRPKIKQE